MAKRRKAKREVLLCPFLHELNNDWMCIYPLRVYCVAAEHGKPRFPSATTAQEYCAGNFRQCEGFRRRALQGP